MTACCRIIRPTPAPAPGALPRDGPRNRMRSPPGAGCRRDNRRHRDPTRCGPRRHLRKDRLRVDPAGQQHGRGRGFRNPLWVWSSQPVTLTAKDGGIGSARPAGSCPSRRVWRSRGTGRPLTGWRQAENATERSGRQTGIAACARGACRNHLATQMVELVAAGRTSVTQSVFSISDQALRKSLHAAAPGMRQRSPDDDAGGTKATGWRALEPPPTHCLVRL